MKQLPQNLEMEQQVLGTLMVQEESICQVEDIIQPSDISGTQNKIIYSSILALHSQGKPHDLVSVTNYLKDNEETDKVGGASYLSSLTDIIPTTSSLRYFAKVIKQKSGLRRIINTASEVIELCQNPGSDPEETISEAEQKLLDGIRAWRRQRTRPWPASAIRNHPWC